MYIAEEFREKKIINKQCSTWNTKQKKMTTKEWGENYWNWLNELNNGQFLRWLRISPKRRNAVITISQFIKSLKQ